MEEVVGAIKRVSDIVAEISAASAEQSSGVAQIEQAVAQMDQATQQNAALVEESAAAAESLRNQAQQLVDAVAVFKISPGHVAAQAASAGCSGVERRGSDRASNVTRPHFGATAPFKAGSARPVSASASTRMAAVTPAADLAPAKTGTDDWESF
jgi:hypothetical protein